MARSRNQGMRDRARSLRKQLTGPERKLWQLIRGRRLAGMKFHRQVQLMDYVVDFANLEHKLIVELDGDSHIGKADEDRSRQSTLERAGYKVLRFGNDDVLRDEEAVVTMILRHIESTP